MGNIFREITGKIDGNSSQESSHDGDAEGRRRRRRKPTGSAGRARKARGAVKPVTPVSSYH